MTPSTGLRRRALYPGPVIDGRPADTAGGRWRRRLERLIVSRREREEAELERLIRSHPRVTRANVVAVISPKGGVGKTTSAFVLGNLIADRLRLRVVAVDANPDFGTLASLTPNRVRCEYTLAELLAEIEQVHTAAVTLRRPGFLPRGKVMRDPDNARVTLRGGAPREIDVEVLAGKDLSAGTELMSTVLRTLTPS